MFLCNNYNNKVNREEGHENGHCILYYYSIYHRCSNEYKISDRQTLKVLAADNAFLDSRF